MGFLLIFQMFYIYFIRGNDTIEMFIQALHGEIDLFELMKSISKVKTLEKFMI